MRGSRRKYFRVFIFLCGISGIGGRNCLAQTGENQAGARAAAATFYRKYLPHFGLPSGPDLKALHPYLSPRLYALLRFENQRLDSWAAQNPDLKPPIVSDLFTCNSYEHPQRFKVGTARAIGSGVAVDVRFELDWHNRVVQRCKVTPYFVFLKGKWLLDDVFYYQDVDLKTLLSRKDYWGLPEWHPPSRRPASPRKE
jgi:hypothetical protein